MFDDYETEIDFETESYSLSPESMQAEDTWTMRLYNLRRTYSEIFDCESDELRVMIF